MKKIFLTLLALLAVTFTAQADAIVSGQQYKIVTLDGTKALTCGATAKNDVTLTLADLSDTDGGQVWTLTANGDYWGITSALGNFNIDNPSSNHDGFHNQLCLWQTNGGNNQKWTFEAADDDTYYMIPFENANKCYALDADGKFTFQDKAADTRVKLVKYVEPEVTINGITSGKYYRICSPDKAMALSNNASTANDLVVSMTAFEKNDLGQIWQLTYKGGYWQVKSACGNVCLDNPAEAHSKFNNQLIQWKTSGGENQKWTFEVVDDGFYMIPFESAEKCYGYNDNGVFIFQDKGGENTKLALVEATLPTTPVANVNGYYTIQALSTYPAYNYTSEGRFLSFSTTGAASLNKSYTYEASRLYISCDENGVATITLPQADKALTTASNTLKAAATDGASKYVIYMNTDELGIDTRVAIHAGETYNAALSGAQLNLLAANTAGTGVTIANAQLTNSFTFRLVALPAADDVEALKTIIDEAKAITGLNEEAAAALNAAITQAQSELDYPYLTKQDVVLDVADLQSAIDVANATLGGNSQGINGNVTGIDEAQTSAIRVEALNHRITVYGAQNVRIFNAAGQRQAANTILPSGAYIVKADGKVVKVVL